MSTHSINYEVPLKVTGPDGTVLWQGSGAFGIVYTCKAVAAITESNVVVIDPAAAIYQATNLGATATYGANVFAVRPSNTTSYGAGVIGAALSTVAASTASAPTYVAVAGPGSIAMVTTASATGTIGRHLRLSATNGVVTDSITAPTNPEQSPGYTIKPSGTTAQPSATDTGTATRLAAYILPH